MTFSVALRVQMREKYPPNPPIPTSKRKPRMLVRMERQRGAFLTGLIGWVSSSLKGLIGCVFPVCSDMMVIILPFELTKFFLIYFVARRMFFPTRQSPSLCGTLRVLRHQVQERWLAMTKQCITN